MIISPRVDSALSSLPVVHRGPILTQLEGVYGAAMARPLYCAVDPALYAPEARDWSYDLGYMGTSAPIVRRRWRACSLNRRGAGHADVL